MHGPHKVECKYLKSTSALERDLLLHQTRLIARIIFKIKLGQGDKAEELPDGSRRSYQDLASHQAQITTDPERKVDFSLCWLQLKSFLQEESDEIYEMAQTAWAKTVINPDKMADEEDNPVACGIFLKASAIDHSCRHTCPNGLFLFTAGLFFKKMGWFENKPHLLISML